MITLKDKQKIILDYISKNKSQREIHRETGIARDTIRKYVTEYEERLRLVGKDLSETEKVDLIDEITQQPKWRDDEIRAKTGHFYSRHVDITRIHSLFLYF